MSNWDTFSLVKASDILLYLVDPTALSNSLFLAICLVILTPWVAPDIGPVAKPPTKNVSVNSYKEFSKAFSSPDIA